jgi:hypothetical protein
MYVSITLFAQTLVFMDVDPPCMILEDGIILFTGVGSTTLSSLWITGMEAVVSGDGIGVFLATGILGGMHFVQMDQDSVVEEVTTWLHIVVGDTTECG